MCRVVALPPGFPKKKAMRIVEDFYIGNEDGVGSVYVEDGKFQVNKWNFSFEKVYKKNLPLFDHMPHNGWTLAHVRAASHGKNTMNNTHPFLTRQHAMIHNGVFGQYEPVKAALSANYKFKGQTDSEVAAMLYEVAGKEKFAKAIDSGVFMFLNRDGRVHVVCKAGGDLVIQKTKHGIVMASELDTSKRQTVLEGVFTLGKNGQIIHSKWERDIPSTWNYGWKNYRSFAPKRQDWSTKKVKLSKFDSDAAEFLDARNRGQVDIYD